jgi:hypothetical protein
MYCEQFFAHKAVLFFCIFFSKFSQIFPRTFVTGAKDIYARWLAEIYQYLYKMLQMVGVGKGGGDLRTSGALLSLQY